jgi:putative ABC transport system permease protein
VLGAKLRNIAIVLLNSTIRQVALATAIGIPVSYYLTYQYLQKFSERISLQWWHFALPVMLLVIIMFLTIARTLWKAAHANPTESLRSE